MKKRILVGGFMPFGCDDINPSWEIVSRLPREIDGVEIETLEIPVIYEQAAHALLKKAEEIDADCVLCFGYNSKARIVEIEYVAINLQRSKVADQAGFIPKDCPIDPDGPLARKTDLPIFELVDRSDRSWPVKISLSAGAYVCNDVMYRLLAWCEDHHKIGGFVHVPPFEEVWGKGMKKEELYQAVYSFFKYFIFLENKRHWQRGE